MFLFLALPLRAEPPALADVVAALRAEPLGSAENLHVALALFGAGRFDDSARHLRRALAASPDALKDQQPLASRVAPRVIEARMAELAPRAESDADLCFLAGALCVLNGDRARALPLLVRAEELAGTDSHAATLLAALTGTPMLDRARQRAVAALRLGRFDEAAHNFAAAAMDCPTCPEHYVGAALARALAGDRAMALRLNDLGLARATYPRLLAWLRDLRLPYGPALAATASAREPLLRNATLVELRLAGFVALAHGMYQTAREAMLAAMFRDKLDIPAVEAMRFMDAHGLSGDPKLELPQPEAPPAEKRPEPEPEPKLEPARAIEEARRQLRRLEYSQALKLLDPLVRAEQQDTAVFFLVFVAGVGRGEPQQAADALQAWFARATPAQRTRLNSVRELFDRAEHFTQWRKLILDLRAADQNAALPRLLNSFVELSAGAYASARAEVQVALIGAPGNEMLKAMQRILEGEAFQQDAAVPALGDKPTAKTLAARADVLFRRGEYEAAKTELLAAQETNPREPGLTEALLRVYFAQGDYARGARQVEALLAEQEVATRAATDLRLFVESGYDAGDVFEKHLSALAGAASERLAAADENLLLGVIQYSRGRWRECADALNEWQGLSLGKVLNVAVLKLLEHARKNA